jgi:hypothetical protein
MESITFQLAARPAAIVKRAAGALRLRIVEQGTDVFTVELRESLDAYRLGQLTVDDPGWAREFLDASKTEW